MKRLSSAVMSFVLAIGFTANAQAETFIFAPAGAEYTFSQDIDSAGNVVGSFTDGNARHGFFYDGSVATVIDLPGAVTTNILGMNDNGDLVGYFNDGAPNYNRGFIKSGNSITVLDYPGAVWTQAIDINDSGVVVGYYNDTYDTGVVRGFIYDGSYTPFDVPNSGITVPRGINNSGVITGSYTSGANVSHGFIYDGGNFTTFDPQDSTNTWVFGMNNNGDLVGTYYKIVKKKTKVFHFIYDGAYVREVAVDGLTAAKVNGINDSGEYTGEGYIGNQIGTKGYIVKDAAALPDLVVTEVKGPSGGRVGNYITITVTVENQGAATAAGTFELGVYLSEDATITTADNRRNTKYPVDMAPGESITYDMDVLLMGNIPPGTYYTGAIADLTEVIAESNDFNNALTGNTLRVRAQK